MIYLSTGEHALATAGAWLPTLRRALEYSDGRWTEDELLEDVEAGRLMVWTITKQDRVVGVFTTRVMKGKVLWVLVEDLAGENMQEWLWDGHRALETWARELGAEQIVLEGRNGWGRALRSLGYETRRIQAVKRLETMQ